MRKLLLSLFIAVIALGFVMTEAHAKRFGGGRSFGMQRTTSSFSRPNAGQAGSAARPNSFANKILPALTGLALGGILASLFMGHGLGTGIFSWLLLIGGAYFLWTLIRSRFQPANQAAHRNNMHSFSSNPFPNNAQPAAWRVESDKRIADFDEISFLRQAKTQFIRLQAAYDCKNTADIREFTTPEVFAEIQLQLQERGNADNITEVVSIDAQLLDVADESQVMVASVLFTGQIREEANTAPTHVKEIWHFNKDNYKSSWLVSGIQQA